MKEVMPTIQEVQFTNGITNGKPNNWIHTISYVDITPGREQEWLDVIRVLAPATAKEEGCI